MFRWENSRNPAKTVGIDLKFTEIGGNTLAFLDTRLQNEKYVTIGMRDFGSRKKIHMSVFKPNIIAKPYKGFTYHRGNENDTYCIGDYDFKLNQWYRLEINGHESYVEGQIYDYNKNANVKIAKFHTGENSFIKIGNRNSISLEHVGMSNPCKIKSEIIIKEPFRLDIYGHEVTATMGQVKYQKCRNSTIEKINNIKIYLAHGGLTNRRKHNHNDWIDWT